MSVASIVLFCAILGFSVVVVAGDRGRDEARRKYSTVRF